MTYDFTQQLNRAGTGSLKWDKYQGRDVLPFWVADMDFVSAPEIREALHKRVDDGVFGYTVPFEEAQQEIMAYLKRMHGYEIEADWLVFLPGMVQGLHIACMAMPESSSVMTPIPIYPPFRSSIVNTGRKRIEAPMHVVDGEWQLDLEKMESLIEPDTSLFLFCNPANPVGRVFRPEEVQAIVDFCERHDLILCSDEIHCDLVLDDVPHICTAVQAPQVADRLITMMAVSKTYNLPGLAFCYAVIPNDTLRTRFKHALRGMVTEMNCFGYAGTIAAYRDGEPWRQALLPVLRKNRDILYAFVREHMPQLKMWSNEATYLAWIDARELGVDDPIAFFESHGVGLSNGADFGAPGFVRLNFGCTEAMLHEGLDRMKRALDSL
ncbi:MAG: cystathionine beta-lyase [Verrucomicrobiales bacterium]|jgi:cystathionine beta-lyase